MNAPTPAIPQSFLVILSKICAIFCFQLGYDIIKINNCIACDNISEFICKNLINPHSHLFLWVD